MTHPRNFTTDTGIALLSWSKSYSGSINTNIVRKLLDNNRAYLLQNTYTAERLGKLSGYTYHAPYPLIDFVIIIKREVEEYALYKSATIPDLYVLLHADDCESIAVINGKMEVPLTL